MSEERPLVEDFEALMDSGDLEGALKLARIMPKGASRYDALKRVGLERARRPLTIPSSASSIEKPTKVPAKIGTRGSQKRRMLRVRRHLEKPDESSHPSEQADKIGGSANAG